MECVIGSSEVFVVFNNDSSIKCSNWFTLYLSIGILCLIKRNKMLKQVEYCSAWFVRQNVYRFRKISQYQKSVSQGFVDNMALRRLVNFSYRYTSLILKKTIPLLSIYLCLPFFEQIVLLS